MLPSRGCCTPVAGSTVTAIGRTVDNLPALPLREGLRRAVVTDNDLEGVDTLLGHQVTNHRHRRLDLAVVRDDDRHRGRVSAPSTFHRPGCGTRVIVTGRALHEPSIRGEQLRTPRHDLVPGPLRESTHCPYNIPHGVTDPFTPDICQSRCL